MSEWLVVLSAMLYLGLLFGVAYVAEYRLRKGRSLVNNAYVYALSLAVYCTAWTYYGSVGRASVKGFEFLTVYLGPTLVAVLFWPLVGKIIKITKTLRINSIADFISTRYGKNISIAVAVTVFCVLGIIPYISIQLKAISISFDTLTGQHPTTEKFFGDSTFYFTVALMVFIILFGTRSVDATEKHEGLVAAIAFESIIKLIAFAAAGIFVTFYVFDGFGDIFSRVYGHPELHNRLTLDARTSYADWTAMLLLSMLAVLFLPRQFQMSVIENVQEKHIRKATWLFPLYLCLINVFVIPVAFGGLIVFDQQGTDPDSFVIALPHYFGKDGLSLLIFIGGFSAATSMIIAETIALATMVSNHMVVPVLLALRRLSQHADASVHRTILYVRRITIASILVMAYWYDRNVANFFSLVSIGLVSFTAVAQFAPSVIGGLYWKAASRKGALIGMCAGMMLWFYTLVVPSMAHANILNASIISDGPFALEWLKPMSLFGLSGLDSVTHGLFWSLGVNTLLFIGISLNGRRSSEEIYQAEIFVNIRRFAQTSENTSAWRGTAYMHDISALLARFIGETRAVNLIQGFALRNRIPLDQQQKADSRLVIYTEKILAGVIGSASARVVVRSVTKEEEIRIEELLSILQESKQIIDLNKELRKKSSELTKATEELRLANDRLLNMDAVKDEFLYTITHELRTPMTSIRAMSEILHDNPDMDSEERQQFLSGIVRETERLTHLITQVLNLEKYESGRQELNIADLDIRRLIEEALFSVKTIAEVRRIGFVMTNNIADTHVRGDKDLLMQVAMNLLSNAIKFAPDRTDVRITLRTDRNTLCIGVHDQGKGVAPEFHEKIFDKFFQAKNQQLQKPEGSGLGLAISRKIIEMHKGRLWVESEPGHGAAFYFTIPHTPVKQENA